MNMTKHNNRYLISLAIAGCLSAAPALAQDAQGPQSTGSVTVGGQTGSGLNDSSKLQQYEMVPKGVTLFDVNFDWKNQSGYFMKFNGSKLGLDDQYAAFQGGQKGSWKLSASLNQNPRWFSNKAETLYNESAPGVLTLPDGMRTSLQRIWSPAATDPAAPANSNDDRFWSMRDYMGGAQPVDLRYVRKTGQVGLDITALENWTFKLSYQRDVRNGHQPVSFTAGPGIDEIANPIQYTTQDTRADVEYAKNGAFLAASYVHSDFQNDVLYTTVDNPVRLTNTDFAWTGAPVVNTAANATARLWNAPANKADSFDATAGIKLPAHSKIALTFSTTTMSVNQALIPQATNPNLNLATTSADYGKFTLTPEYASVSPKLNQVLFMANLSGEPSAMFGYSAFYRLFDLKDKTPTYTFHSTVNSDGGASYSAAGVTSSEDARAYKSHQLKAEVHVTPARGLRLGVNAGQLTTDYEDRNWTVVKDNSFGATVDANISWAMFHAGLSSVKREPSSPNAEEAAEGTTGGRLTQGAEMKDNAKQTSTIYNAALTLTPLDAFALTFSTQGVKSDFPATTVGLAKSTVNNFGVDATYALTDRFSVNAGYIYEKLAMDTNFWYSANGTVTNPVATNTSDQYWNSINDKVDTFTAGFRWSLSPGKVDLGSDFSSSKGRSDSGFRIVPGGAQAGGDMLFPTNTTTVNFTQMQYLNYPQVFNKSTMWKTWLSYHVDKNVTLSVMYWMQKFDQADWAYDGIGVYMLTGSALYASTPGAVANLYPQLDPSANRALFLNATVPNYNASIFRVSVNYRF
jgi:MtrB/PioB family decaheme-associated outer membrane protein